MKGLLTKDFYLLFNRKRSFLVIFLCDLMVSFSTDPAFAVCFPVLIGSMFSLSTIAYDEHDNCFPFLMTLPASRRCYAVEKYVFGLCLGAVCWVAAIAFCFAATAVKGTAGTVFTGVGPLLAMLFLPLVLLDVSIPLNLKFGSEKGRIYMVVLWGVLFGGAYFLIGRAASEASAVEALLSGKICLWGAAALAALTAASVALSIRVMEKKEF